METRNDEKVCSSYSHLNIVENILELPGTILKNHDKHGIHDLILHNIASEKCLNFSKAAYLIDNPDFNCLQGICGYSKKCSPKLTALETDKQLEAIKNCQYNTLVKDFKDESLKAKNITFSDSNFKNLHKLAQSLEIEKPEIFSWDLKHNNYGILIFENQEKHCCNWKEKLLSKVAHLLGMCGF